jgi:hypothetical protein
MDGNVYALFPNGTKRWSFAMKNSSWSSPAIGPDGTIYVGSWDANLYAINSDGTEKWSFATGGAIDSSPAIGPDGTIYVGSFDYNLYAITSNGALKWKFPTGGDILSSPAIGVDGTIYVGSDDSYFYAVNGDGTGKWIFRTFNGIPSSPALGKDGAIYFGSWDGNCYAVNPDGSQRWSFTTGNSIYSGPAIGSDGTVYVASDDDNLYAIGTGPNGVSVSSLTLDFSSVVSGETATGTVNLAGLAPVGGEKVALSSSDPSAIVPASVQVPGGTTIATFTISTIGVATTTHVVITASAAASSATANFIVTPAVPTNLFISPVSVTGGTASVGTILLNGIPPAGGMTLALSTSNPSVTPPATVTVPEGQQEASFTLNTSAVSSNTSATITATFGKVTETASLMVVPPVIASVSINPSTLAGGNNAVGAVTLSGPATAGTVVLLSSNNAAVTVPASVAFSAGQSTATFAVKTAVLTAQVVATVTGTFNSLAQTTTVTVNPATLASVSLSPDAVTGGSSSSGTVTLTGPAPKGGLTVKLKSSKSQATVPSTVSIAAGASTATFTVKTAAVTAQVAASISGTLGAVTQTANLTINPPQLASIALSPATVQGGASSKATVSLTGPAPAGGLKVSLSSSVSAATLPADVLIGAGKSSGVVTVKTAAVPVLKVASISGTLAGISMSSVLTINPPVLISLTLSPAKVVGGANSTGTVTISSPAPTGGLVVSLQSNQGSASVPSKVTVPAGKTTAKFGVKTSKVKSSTTVSITGSLSGVTETATLTIS